MQLSPLQRTCDPSGPRITRAAAAAAAAVHKPPQTGRKRGIQEADLPPDLLSRDEEQPKLGRARALRSASEWSISFLTLTSLHLVSADDVYITPCSATNILTNAP